MNVTILEAYMLGECNQLYHSHIATLQLHQCPIKKYIEILQKAPFFKGFRFIQNFVPASLVNV